MLSPEDRRRHARQLLLPEIGEAGQRALLDARVSAGSDVAALYLERAGLQVARGAEAPAATATPELAEAARFLAGAFEAVETIKRVVGVGQPGRLDVSLRGPGER